MGVMTAMLRRHGATLVERHGRPVAAHFGSAASEAAVCRGAVGLAERSDRATIEVRAAPAEVDRALAELARLGDRAWAQRLGPGRALVRCEGDEEGACTSAMLRAQDAWVHDVSADFAALELVGPRAEQVVEAAAIDPQADPVTILRESGTGIELLVPRGQGPALFNRLLEAGGPLGIACVGLDALEHLHVSEHLAGR